MEKIFLIDNTEILCKIYKRSKKNIIFKFEKNILHISTPKYFPMKELKKILENRKDWIKENLNKSKIPNKHFFLGNETENEEKMIDYYNLEFGKDFLSLNDIINHIFTERFEFCLQQTGFHINNLKIKKMKSAWGICYRNRNITLNLLLICCPISVIDYVIFHELCHLKHMNHSKDFWAEVAKFCPQYKVHKLWLKTNGVALMNQTYL